MSFWPLNCFKDKQVLIVGGSSGIGAAVATGFLEEGAMVTFTGVTQEEVDAAKTILPGATGARLDVRDQTDVECLVDGFDELHHVVNCAGVIHRDAEFDPEVFDQVLDINLSGTMRVCTAARPRLAVTKGTIVNTASMLSFFGGGLVPGYAASKGGIAQLTKSLAIAFAEDGIRVNAIAPG